MYTIRKKRNQELSNEEKNTTKVILEKQIMIEHTICRLKMYRIMSDIFRNMSRKYNRVSDIVTGQLNYRLMNQYY
ncbi:MAG TPA: transposase family protein [Candidatus Nitrosocosmicus sp.]